MIELPNKKRVDLIFLANKEGARREREKVKRLKQFVYALLDIFPLCPPDPNAWNCNSCKRLRDEFGDVLKEFEKGREL